MNKTEQGNHDPDEGTGIVRFRSKSAQSAWHIPLRGAFPKGNSLTHLHHFQFTMHCEIICMHITKSISIIRFKVFPITHPYLFSLNGMIQRNLFFQGQDNDLFEKQMFQRRQALHIIGNVRAWIVKKQGMLKAHLRFCLFGIRMFHDSKS